MTQVPKAIVDLGLTAVALFFFVSAIFLIYKIVLAVRANSGKVPDEAGPVGGKNGRTPCIQQPAIVTLGTNQALIMDMLKRAELVEVKIGDNMLLQTELMKRVAAVQEDIGRCMTRMQARDELRDA